jgi:PAS domain S-box-containing protein
MSSSTVLLVEDNPITRKMMRFALEAEGYAVLEAGAGAAALQIAAENRPDLLLLDYVLPDMDGLRLLAEVRRQAARQIPAVVVTGMVSRLEEMRNGNGAFTQFLAKPVELSLLLEVVRAQLVAPEPGSGGRRVLVIDDDHLNRKLTAIRLRQAGYEVDTAPGGAEGLIQARRRPPDAILSDVLMPGMDGFAFCREARRDPALASIPIVLFSSAYVEEADRELARKMGASALVVRTSDLRAAAAALEESLRRTTPPPMPAADDQVLALHHERLQVQLERQTALNEALLRQVAIQATALSITRGLSEVLAQPKDVPQILGDVLIHCLDAAGLSAGLLFVVEPGGGHRLQTQFGIPADRRADAEGCFGHPELLRRIVESRQPVALSSGAENADAEVRDFLARMGHSSVLVVPFVVLGEIFGAAVLASDGHEFRGNAWIGFARDLALQFGQTIALGQALKRLAESEARSRVLMEQANDAISILSPEGVLLQANRQMETLLGRPAERLIGQHISEFAPEGADGTPKRVQQFQQVLAAGGGRADNVLLRRGDGTLVEVDFSVSVNEIDGKAYVLALGRDVTERNRAAAALREAQDRLQHVVSSSPAVLYLLKPEGDRFVVTWISENLERVLGHARRGPGARLVALAASPGRGRACALRHSHDLHERPRDPRIPIPQPAGRIPLAPRRAAAPAGPGGEPRGGGGILGGRLRAEGSGAEARAERRAVSAALRQQPPPHDGLRRGDLRLPRCQRRFVAPLRLLAGGIPGHDGQGPSSDRRGGLDRAVRATRCRGERSFKRRSQHAAPEEGRLVIEVEIAASRIVLRGRPAWLALAMDVTEKRSLEEQLLQAQKIESMGRLAGGVAHDFNNLLGVISGYGALLRQQVGDNPRLKKYVDDILKASDRAAGLTRQLLAFSRKQVLQPRILDLNAIVGEVEDAGPAHR